MPVALVALNLLGGACFVAVAMKGYWDYAGWFAIAVLLATLAAGMVLSWLCSLFQS